METIWFCLVAVMLATYVVLDGFDLGAGVAHLLIARTDAERRLVLRSIGPVWDGNEVWLLAAGGTLYFAFPGLYASSFSGFYLPLMIVLWLLILRGISIEFRNHIESLVWHPLWDAVFAGSSALLAIFFGAALGNVVRGVPLDRAGDFFLPLWTNFSAGQDAGILDWYTILIAVAALLTAHRPRSFVDRAQERRRGRTARPVARVARMVGHPRRRHRDYTRQLPHPAALAGKFHRPPVVLYLPPDRARGPRRNEADERRPPRPGRLRRFLPLHRRHAAAASPPACTPTSYPPTRIRRDRSPSSIPPPRATVSRSD